MRALRWFAFVLVAAGALLVAEAAITVRWQEPLSALQTRREQAELDRELERIESLVRPRFVAVKAERRPSRAERLRAAAGSFRRGLDAGRALGRISIPAIDASFVVVEGADPEKLKRGPGRYRFTGLPGEGRTVGIAGHRTTYLAPFRRLDELRPGDAITLTMPYGRFEYRVTRTKIVSPRAIAVLRSVGYERVVLTACHPLYSAAQRIVVFARLVGAAERGARAHN